MPLQFTSRHLVLALFAASGIGFGLGACAQDPGPSCNAGTLNCVCISGTCYPGLTCIANYCVMGSAEGDETSGDGDGDPTTTGDGDGDPTTGDGDGDPTTTGDGDGDPTTGDGDGDPTTTGGGVGPGEPCDLYAQDCVDGYKCQPGDPAVCTMLPAVPDGEGDDCDLNADSCDLGLACLYTGDPDIGACYPLCAGSMDNPVCDPGQFCADANPPLCLSNCDPLAQDCAAIEACYALTTDMQFVCIPAGDIPVGEACGFLNDCGVGLACTQNGCAEFCDVNNPPLDCDCQELWDSVGLCVL
jgi:hypothetical protein